MSAAVNDLLNIARAQLGIAEGPGSNNVKFNTWYYGQPVVGDNYAWCAAFVSWVADQAGMGEEFGKLAYCPSVVNHWQAKGQWGSVPRIGAQVVYKWPNMGRPCHTGIVESVFPGGIVAIEGNTDVAGGRTGGRVMRQARRSNIVGYGYPVYAGASATPAPAGGGLVVDGDWGHNTTVALQQALGVTADGEFGPKSKRALQARVAAVPDGIIGPHTIAALQRYLTSKGFGCYVDGELGPQTVRAMQSCLNARKF